MRQPSNDASWGSLTSSQTFEESAVERVASQYSTRPSRSSRSTPASARSRSPGYRAKQEHDNDDDRTKKKTYASVHSVLNSEDLNERMDEVERARAALEKEREDLHKQMEELEKARAALEKEKEEWARQCQLRGSGCSHSSEEQAQSRPSERSLILTPRRNRVMPCFKRIFCCWMSGSEPEPSPDLSLMNMDAVPVGSDALQSNLLSRSSVYASGSNGLRIPQGDSSANRTRSWSILSFRTARSLSRDVSCNMGSGVFPDGSGSNRYRRSGRAGSRNSGDDTITASSGGDAITAPQRDPLELLRQVVTDTLAKCDLSRDLEDPLIKMLVESSPDAKTNATIRSELMRNHPDLRSTVLANFTPLMFRDLIYAVFGVLEPMQQTEFHKLVEYFENQWLIKVLPGANKLISGRRSYEQYAPIDTYARRANGEPLRLAEVIKHDQRHHKPAGEGVLWAQRILELVEGLLSSLFRIMPPAEGETLHYWKSRVVQDSRDWRSYWRVHYGNSRLRLEVLGFAVGSLVDVKMKGSPATLYPPAMMDAVFGDSILAVDDFLLDLRITMRLLDLLI